MREAPQGGRDFFVSGKSNEANGGVAESRQILGCVPLLNLAVVFAEGDVPYPVQAFYAPVGSPAIQKKCCISAWRRHAADRMLHLGGLLAFAESDAFQAADLGQAGPIEMLSQSGTGLQMPFDEPSVSFAR